MRKRLQLLSLVAVCTAFLSASSWAQSVYVANESKQQLDLVNLNTGVINVLFSTVAMGGKPDSVILNSNGQLIYTMTNIGLLCMYDPLTGQNTVLASGLSYPRDLVFDPGTENSLLIALYARGQIARFDMLTGTVTILTKYLGTADGLAYDPAGDLFVVANHNKVCQINPVVGTVLKCIVLEPHYRVNGGDGMTYDPYSGHLWVSHVGTLGNGLIELSTDLSTMTWFQSGNILVPDGIVPDGYGNLFIGAGLHNVVEYNIPTDTITKSVLVKGVDDVALVPGTY
jgi:hypothetical protein